MRESKTERKKERKREIGRGREGGRVVDAHIERRRELDKDRG